MSIWVIRTEKMAQRGDPNDKAYARCPLTVRPGPKLNANMGRNGSTTDKSGHSRHSLVFSRVRPGPTQQRPASNQSTARPPARPQLPRRRTNPARRWPDPTPTGQIHPVPRGSGARHQSSCLAGHAHRRGHRRWPPPPASSKATSCITCGHNSSSSFAGRSELGEGGPGHGELLPGRGEGGPGAASSWSGAARLQRVLGRVRRGRAGHGELGASCGELLAGRGEGGPGAASSWSGTAREGRPQ